MGSRLSSPGAATAGAAAFSVVAWASAFVSIRSAGAAYSPGALALGRLLTASLVLVALVAVRREGLPARGALRGILVSGVVWFGGYMVVLNWGERLVDAGTAALLVNVGPVLMALLAARLLGEVLPPRLLAGIAVSFGGAVVVGLSTSSGHDGDTSVLGVLLCLLAAVAYAVGVVVQKPALAYGTPLQITACSCLAGTVACLPFAGQLAGELPKAPLSATLNMLYLGVVPTALAFTTWSYALARTPAGRMGATTYAVPAIVVVLSWVFLDEVPAWLTLVGGALCLAGVAVSRSRPRHRTPGTAAARGAENEPADATR
ncbi:DMT family transporter [Streptomyces sp. NPDC002004]